MTFRAPAFTTVALLALAAAIPLGEGVAQAAAVALGLGLWTMRSQLRLAVVRRPTETGQWLMMMGIWFVAGAAAWWLGDEGWRRPRELARWLPLLVLPAVVLLGTALPRPPLRRAVVIFVLVLGASSVFGLIQFGFNTHAGETMLRGAGMVAPQASVPGNRGAAVAGGFFFHRLKMADTLLMGLAVVVGRLMSFSGSRRSWWIHLALGALFATTLLFTFSRAALLAGFAAFGVCVLVVPFRGRRGAVVGGLMAVVLAVSVPAVRDRAVSILGRQASDVRGMIWAQGVEVIQDHPWGAGLGNYPRVVGRYYDAAQPTFTVRTYPHSVVLATWAETGWVGVAAFVSAWWLLGQAFFRRLRDDTINDPDQRAAAVAGFFALVAFAVVGLTHDILYHLPVAFALAFVLGCAVVLSTSPNDHATSDKGQP